MSPPQKSSVLPKIIPVVISIMNWFLKPFSIWSQDILASSLNTSFYRVLCPSSSRLYIVIYPNTLFYFPTTASSLIYYEGAVKDMVCDQFAFFWISTLILNQWSSLRQFISSFWFFYKLFSSCRRWIPIVRTKWAKDKNCLENFLEESKLSTTITFYCCFCYFLIYRFLFYLYLFCYYYSYSLQHFRTPLIFYVPVELPLEVPHRPLTSGF